MTDFRRNFSPLVQAKRPFLPLLLLHMYLFMPGVGLWLMSLTGGGGYLGSSDVELVRAYFIHASIVFLLAYYFSGWRTGQKLSRSKFVFVRSHFFRSSVVLMLLVTLTLFFFGGARILFFGEDRGVLRTSLGSLGFFYTWLQIYVTPFIVAMVVARQISCGGRVRMAALIVYLLGLFVGIMSGYKFTTILIFLPALSMAFSKLRLLRIFQLAVGVLAILMLTETMQSGRQPGESLAYLTARSTTIAAYGAMGSWMEFANDGLSIDRVMNSGMLLFGNKLAAALSGVPEDSIDFLRYNLARYVTYLYYPDSEGAVSGTVNLTLTVFGEGVAMFGGSLYWIWSLTTGAVVGFVLRAYVRAQARGDILSAVLWLVYYFSVILSWINSSGWVKIISVPIVLGMIMLHGVVAKLLHVGRLPVSSSASLDGVQKYA